MVNPKRKRELSALFKLRSFWNRLKKYSVKSKKCSKCKLVLPISNFDFRFGSENRSAHAVFFRGRWYYETRAECIECKSLAATKDGLERLVRLP